MSIRQQMIDAGLWNKDDSRDPSKDIAAAWLVVEKVIAGDEYEIGFENGQHYAKLGSAKGGYAWAGQGTAPTAPHAICLAALKAVGVLE